MIKAWSDAAWEDFEYWMKQDKKTLKRIIIQLLSSSSKQRVGKPYKYAFPGLFYIVWL